MNRVQKNILLETVAVLLAALGLTALVLRWRTGLVLRYSEIIIAAIWLYLPLCIILARKVSLAELSLEKLRPGKSLRWFGISTAVVLPSFYLATFLGAVKLLHYGFRLEKPELFWSLFFGQLLVVSLPEEWFFRGYLQGRLNQLFARNWNLLSAKIGPSLFLSAALFALAHLALKPSLDRVLVFFPALVFGWLREKTDSLLAPILFHFLANLSFIIFQASLLK